MDIKDIIKKLKHLDVSSKTETKQKLTYLSWTWAWDEVLKNCPQATYEVVKQENGLPYVYDESTGYMVFTKVTIEGLTHEMWLPVMDGANKAMKDKPYSYEGNGWENGKRVKVTKTVESATMFDINKTIMRCLTKNLAMFGLGLYIYAGEDLPEALNELTKDRFESALKALGEGKTTKENILKFDLTKEQEEKLNKI